MIKFNLNKNQNILLIIIEETKKIIIKQKTNKKSIFEFFYFLLNILSNKFHYKFNFFYLMYKINNIIKIF